MCKPTDDDERSATLPESTTEGDESSDDESDTELENDVAWMYIESDYSEDEDDGDEEEDKSILVDGCYYTNETLMEDMWSPELYGDDLLNNHKFFNKIRRYLRSIDESDGFDISDSDWPGIIWGITTVAPRSKHVIGKKDCCPEGYMYIMLLADEALKFYNKKHDSYYQVDRIEKVNSRTTQGYIFYITFTAYEDAADHNMVTFQASVWDNVPGRFTEVESCCLKSG